MADVLTAGAGSRTLYICPLQHGGWSVFGSDIARVLNTFDLRDEAVKYACGLAEHLTPAKVQILGWNGSVEEDDACASMKWAVDDVA